MPITPLSASSAQHGALVCIGTTNQFNVSTAIGFVGIPQTYTDLLLVLNIRATPEGTNGGLSINAGGTFCHQSLQSTGIAVSAGAVNNYPYGYQSATVWNSAPAYLEFHFPNYANTTTNKNYICRAAAGTGIENRQSVAITAGMLMGTTAAITSVSFSTANGTINWIGEASLYGIRTVNK
jgi:hypothetical protein